MSMMKPLDAPQDFTYYFHQDVRVVVYNAVSMNVHPGGSHVLLTGEGVTHQIATGWYHLEIRPRRAQ